MLVVKKYANRRLYDTEESRYITLEELADKIRQGADARVVDAATGEDLTQATLAQIILESRGASRLLPVPLLTQLIRMGDDALAEFLGRYLGAALDLYLQARQGAQALKPYNPFADVPFTAVNALARMMMGVTGLKSWGEAPPPATNGSSAPPPPAEGSGEIADLRREVEELKRSLHVDGRAARGAKPARKARR